MLKKLINKSINILLSFAIFFSYVAPVYALESNDNTSNSNGNVSLNDKVLGFKSNSSSTDFNYKVDVDDSIRMVYSSDFNKAEYFTNVLNNKLNDTNVNSSVNSVSDSKVKYTLNGYGETYSGVFSYSLTLNLTLSDLKEETIINYFKNILGDVEVTVFLDNKDYKVTINGVSKVFKISAKTSNVSIPDATVSYQAHVQDYGWMKEVSDGTLAGIEGKALRLEALKIKVNSTLKGSVKYQTHVQDQGWQKYVSDGSLTGSEGKSRRIEGIRIELTGELEKNYDIYYRVHVQEYGWLGWAKNGDLAGTFGKSLRVEAINIVLVKKGEVGMDTTSKVSTTNKAMSLHYSAHVSGNGWWPDVENGVQTGAAGKNIEAVKVTLDNISTDGNIYYQAHVQDVGWMSQVGNGQIGGTTGQSRRLEAFKIMLTGSLGEKYDIYYRVYVDGVNKWLGWAKNGDEVGSSGAGKAIQQIEIRLVKKGDETPEITDENPAFIEEIPHVNYSTYVDGKDWQKTVSDGNTSGITGLGIKGIKIDVQSPFYDGSISYQVKTKNSGWVSNNVRGNTIDENLEAIMINLEGNIAKEYNVYYRVYIRDKGWLPWTCNGGKAGSESLNLSIEAIQIKLVTVRASQPSTSYKSFISPDASISYQTHVQEYGWMPAVKDGAIGGTEGKALRLEALAISLSNTSLDGGVKYSVNVGRRGWQSSVSNGTIAGTIGESLKIEGIRINLTGEIANYYNIYYRIHVQDFGWLGWAKDGQITGTSGSGSRVEAIQIKLVPVGDPAPGKTTGLYYQGTWGLETYSSLGTFQTYVDPLGRRANDFKYIDGEKYFFNSKGYLIVRNAKRIIDVSANNGIIDWNAVKNSGIDDEKDEVDGVIVRIASWLQKGLDTQLGYNVSELNRLNIPYGAYLYSYAQDLSESVNTPTLKLENAHCGRLDARAIKYAVDNYNMHLSYPIYYDLEKWEDGSNGEWTWANYAPIVNEFNAEMQSYGGVFANWQIYSGPYWAMQTLSGSNVVDRISWIAHYSHFSSIFNMNRTYNMWQYTSSDIVPGISKNVDSSVYGNFVWRA